MATSQLEALQKIKDIQSQALKEEYGGKASNQFIKETKNSALFQCNWGELLSAAPTALSLMGSCWIAASQEKAEQIMLGDSRPQGGFKYLSNREKPTLRACLVDVCNNGGSRAFKLAGSNMDILRTRSQAIYGQGGRIDVVFLRLPGCTKSTAALEDFNDALDSLAEDAAYCAEVAKQTREAFDTWGCMVGELHATVEQKYGTTSVQSEKVSVEAKVADIEQTFAQQNKEETDNQVRQSLDRMKNSEKRLDRAMENVPSPWATVAMSATSAFAQAAPAIIGGLLPAVLSSVNPGMAIGQALGGALKGANGQQNGNGANQQQQGNAAATVPQHAGDDPAVNAATQLTPLLNTYYEFLGGEKGKIDWTKFSNDPPTDPEAAKTDQGVSWLLGTLNGQKSKIEFTEADTSKKIQDVFTKSVEVTKKIQTSLEGSKDLNAEPVKDEVVNAWKAEIKAALNTCLSLSSATNLSGSASVPNAFANVKINVPPTDLSAQNAALSGAMQGVQIAQQAHDLAEEKYELSLEKQRKMQAALLQVQTKLKALQENGKTLESIKSVLRDCISVLVDLAEQVAKIERFFTMLKNLISEVVQPKVNDFKALMGKAGKRSLAAGQLTVDDISKQLIYTATLQIKAYFSLLHDIADMYCTIDRDYIVQGMQICGQLSKVAATKEDTGPNLAKLTEFSETATAAVNALVNTAQAEIMNDLKGRAQRAQETTLLLEEAGAKGGIELGSIKEAITAGAETAKDEAKQLMESVSSATEKVVNLDDY